MKTRDFQNASWWDEQVKTHGHALGSSDYSARSHAHRLQAFAKVLYDLFGYGTFSLLDVPCGVGLLPAELQCAPLRYTGVDFSPEALRECREHVPDAELLQVDLGAADWHRLIPAQAYDAIVCCGLFCFDGLFAGETAAAQFTQELLEHAGTKQAVLLANFPWAGDNSYCEGIQRYRIDNTLIELQRAGLHGRARFDYLPHEFMCTVRQ